MKKNTPENQTTEKRFVKHIFSDTELLAIAKESAIEQQNISRFESQKKMVVKDFDGKIAASESKIESCSIQINNGFDFQFVNCIITLNSPKTGIKSITRTDTGEILCEKMTEEELQEVLNL